MCSNAEWGMKVGYIWRMKVGENQPHQEVGDGTREWAFGFHHISIQSSIQVFEIRWIIWSISLFVYECLAFSKHM